MPTLTRLCLVVIVLFVAATRASAAPGAATLVSPNGIVTGTTIAFSWDAVPDATWYQFWLGTRSPSALVQSQWYTAAQAGCAGGGTCTITVTPPIAPGDYLWFIQTWGGGDGPWSAGKAFGFRDAPSWGRKLPDPQRFTLVLDNEAVLDNESGLIWQRTPATATSQWQSAIAACVTVNTGGRYGWRVPTLHELGTLAVNGGTPALAAGHPFTLGTTPTFWSETIYGPGPNVLAANLQGPTYFVTQHDPASATLRTMCVRAPTGANK